MTTKIVFSACLCMTLIMPSNALAKEWPSVGWFDIVEGETGCGALAEYSFDGRSDVELLLILNEDDSVGLSVSSHDWSAIKDQLYPEVTYSLNGFIYSEPKNDKGEVIKVTKGIVQTDGRKGFIRPFNIGFLDDFAKGKSLLIENGDAVITHINLYSSGAAVKTLRDCAAFVKSKNDTKRRKEAQWDYIEKDPFEAANQKLAANRPPAPRGHQGYWVNGPDYPPAALAEKRQGTVSFRLKVGVDGKPLACDILQSSGHADLDAETCKILLRRARFEPGTDENAKPTESFWSSRVNWAIPSDEATVNTPAMPQ